MGRKDQLIDQYEAQLAQAEKINSDLTKKAIKLEHELELKITKHN